MRAIFALFIWIGIPVILITSFNLEGVLWKFILGAVFGFAALLYYGLSSK